MNNEIDYEEFIKNIGCTFYEKIDVDNLKSATYRV